MRELEGFKYEKGIHTGANHYCHRAHPNRLRDGPALVDFGEVWKQHDDWLEEQLPYMHFGNIRKSQQGACLSRDDTGIEFAYSTAFLLEDADAASSHWFLLLITKQDHYQAAIAKAKQNPNRRLNLATVEGDVEGASKAIEDGANVNEWLYANYKKPLHFALSEDQVDIARLLLDVGANVSVFKHHNLAAIHNSQPIPKSMELLTMDSRLKEGWYASIEERRVREERSKNYNVDFCST